MRDQRMPTVIALDVSLSMCRPIGSFPPDAPEDEIPTRKKLAIQAVHQFLDHIGAHCKLEFVALIVFSTHYEILTHPTYFIRDLDVIRSYLNNLSDYDKTNFEAVLSGITTMVVEQWGTTVPVQVLLVTDGSPGFGPGSLRDVSQNCKAKPFPFPAKMNILSISDPDDKNYSENCQMLQKLIELTCGDGVVYFPESHLTQKGCIGAVSKLCAKDFTPYKGVLRCGNLSSKITLCPPPQPYVGRTNEKRIEISETIDIIGFLTIAELASPPAHSRHLLLPLRTLDKIAVDGLTWDHFHRLQEVQVCHPTNFHEEKTARHIIETSHFGETKGEDMDDDADGVTPNFCVLLHGAMKVENLCAIAEVGENWFGFIYSWADSKKKSNLMLSILQPGNDVVPWLGNLQEIGSKDELMNRLSAKYAETNLPPPPLPSFPVKYMEKKSYASNPTVWITTAGINSDIQKLLRHARKLPEKSQQFFKELNRMRRWALTIGFHEILESIAQVLERECMACSPSNMNPEASIILTQASSQLRSQLQYSQNISAHNKT